MENLKPLIELIDKIFKKGNYTEEYNSIYDLLSQEKDNKPSVPQKCAKFMNEQLHDNLFADVGIDKESEPENKDDLYKVAQSRAQHSVITYFMGLVFKQFGGIFDKIDDNETLWRKTAMYHDKGYYSTYVSRKELDLRKDTNIKWYLLDDKYESDLQILNGYRNNHSEDFAYEYLDLINYFKYFALRKQRIKDDPKINDEDNFEFRVENQEHGILGGTLIFNELINKLINNKNYNHKELEEIKKFCLAIAQHNIYKIKGDEDIHTAYEVSDDFADKINKVKIDEKTPLLLFLSLVDTVECIKKFSKEKNSGHHFNTKTVLEKLYLSVEKDKIVLDFSRLRKHAEQYNKIEWFEKIFGNKTKGYVNSVESLSGWTVLSGKCDDNNSDIITIQKGNL